MSYKRGVTTWLFRGKDLSILLNMHMPHHFKAEASNGFHVERSSSQVLAVCTVILFCVHGTAAQRLLKMLWLLHTVDLSAWMLCQSVFRGRIFTLMKSSIIESPQARNDLCNDGNIAMKDTYAKEVIVDLVTIISLLV